MARVTQSVQSPVGINVFGSALIRVSPDMAMLSFAVSRVEDHPKDAFQRTREAVQQVRSFLSNAPVDDVSTSRISLEEAYRYNGGENKFIGYRARVSFSVLMSNLDSLETVMVGLVDAGVNQISNVSYETTELKSLRAEARRRAVRAAREKAENYCRESGVVLGEVLHIEDVNPDQLSGREGHYLRTTVIDDEGDVEAFDPGSVVVSGAVMMTFAISSAN